MIKPIYLSPFDPQNNKYKINHQVSNKSTLSPIDNPINSLLKLSPNMDKSR